MRSYISLLSVMVALITLSASPSWAASAEAACASLKRSNIDCACVAKRVERFEAAAPDALMVDLIGESYRYALGKENSYEVLLQGMMADQARILPRMTAFDIIGGRPENVDDFESACVIKGAPLPLIPDVPTFPAALKNIEACSAAGSEERVCQCDAAQLNRDLTPREFEAYFRSFSDYDDNATTLKQLNESRGRAMGMSGDAFDRLQATARQKIEPNREADRAYCSAMTFADKHVGFTIEERLLAGFGDDSAAPDVEAVPDMSGATPRERMINICTEDQSDPAVCECMVSKMESQLSIKDFALMVDLREADMDGADNLMAAVARKRGVSESSIQRQVMQNPPLMTGMMGMDLMDCLGGMPDLGTIPGFSQ